MSETKGCMILLFMAFLMFFFFLMTAQVCTARKLQTFMTTQEKINEKTCRQDLQQDSDIRQLKQDAEIRNRLLTSKEFLLEEKL